MILDEGKEQLISSGMEESQSFGMEASAKAFQILSDNLYSDKVLVVVREYLCNALDSYKVAGSNKQIVITVPTTFEPTFEVEDFGVGLTPEEVRSVYTVYFRSTKTHSNVETGCMGLGSKSAFAYSESFTIISTKDGLRSAYSCYMDADGAPQLASLWEEVTEESNGVKVSIPVNPKDVNKFINSLQKVLQVFPEGSYTFKEQDVEVTPQQYEQTIKVSGHEVKYTITYNRQNKYDVVMSNVKYNFPVRSIIKGLALKLWEDSDIDPSVVLEVPPGKVAFTPSRESLSLTKKTTTYLNKVLTAIAIKEVRKVQEATKKYSDTPLRFYKEFSGKPWWNIYKSIPYWGKDKNLSFEKIRVSKGTHFMYQFEEVKYYKFYSGKFQSGKSLTTDYQLIDAICNSILVLDDREKKTPYVTQMKEYFEGKRKAILVITKHELDLIQEQLGDVEYTTLSSFVVASKKGVRVRTYGKLPDTTVFGQWASKGKGYLEAISKSVEGLSVAYMHLSKGDWRGIKVKIDGNYYVYTSTSMNQLLDALGLDAIIGVNSNNANKIHRLGIPSLDQVVKEKIPEEYRLSTYVLANQPTKYTKLPELVWSKTPSGRKYLKLRSNSLSVSSLPGIIASEKDQKMVNTLVEKVDTQTAAVIDKYPLLRSLRDCKDEAALKQYLKIKD